MDLFVHTHTHTHTLRSSLPCMMRVPSFRRLDDRSLVVVDRSKSEIVPNPSVTGRKQGCTPVTLEMESAAAKHQVFQRAHLRSASPLMPRCVASTSCNDKRRNPRPLSSRVGQAKKKEYFCPRAESISSVRHAGKNAKKQKQKKLLLLLFLLRGLKQQKWTLDPQITSPPSPPPSRKMVRKRQKNTQPEYFSSQAVAVVSGSDVFVIVAIDDGVAATAAVVLCLVLSGTSTALDANSSEQLWRPFFVLVLPIGGRRGGGGGEKPCAHFPSKSSEVRKKIPASGESIIGLFYLLTAAAAAAAALL